MPIVRMPDGTQVRFPDEMPREEIQRLIAGRFPDAVPGAGAQTQPQTFSELRDAGMLQQTPGNEDLLLPDAPAQPEPVSGQTGVPSLPGVFGDVQNAERAFSNALTQGATFGFADEIAAALASPVQATASGETLPQAFEEQIGDIRGIEAELAEQNPVASTAGNIAGAVGSGVGLARGGVSLMNGARPTAASMGARGATEGALYGAAHGFGSGENMDERVSAAIDGGLWGGAMGGVLGSGSGALANRAAQRGVPSLQELDDQSRALYEAARQNGAQLPQAQASQMADNMRQIAQAEGIITPTGRINESYAKIGPLIRSFDDYAQGNLTVDQMQSVRRLIGNALKSTDADERRIAMAMMDEFHKFLDPIAPQIAQANQLYRQMKTGEMIDTAIELAGSRAGQFSGSGFENALRTEFRALERQIIKGQLKGLTEAQKEAISRVAQGGPVENALRALGKLAPTGVVSMGMTSAVPYYIGNSVGGPAMGATAAGATMGAGFLGRQAATNMTANNAQVAAALARSGGAPMEISPARQAIVDALVAGQASEANALPANANTALRALLTGTTQ